MICSTTRCETRVHKSASKRPNGRWNNFFIYKLRHGFVVMMRHGLSQCKGRCMSIPCNRYVTYVKLTSYSKLNYWCPIQNIINPRQLSSFDSYPFPSIFIKLTTGLSGTRTEGPTGYKITSMFIKNETNYKF